MKNLTSRSLTTVAITFFVLASTSFADNLNTTRNVNGTPKVTDYSRRAVGEHAMNAEGTLIRAFGPARGVSDADFDDDSEIGTIEWLVPNESSTVAKARRGLTRSNSATAGRNRRVDPKKVVTYVIFDLQDDLEPDDDYVKGTKVAEISELHGVTGKRVVVGWVTFRPDELPEVQTYSVETKSSDEEYAKIVATFETMHLGWQRTRKMRTLKEKGLALIVASGKFFPKERDLIRQFYIEANYTPAK